MATAATLTLAALVLLRLRPLGLCLIGLGTWLLTTDWAMKQTYRAHRKILLKQAQLYKSR